VGYYGVYVGLRIHTHRQLIQKLDQETYDASETITVTIPISLPYQMDWEDFHRVDGEFEKDGEFYNLVKQKMERDTLTIVYIKDHKEKTLFESLTDFVDANTDSPLSKKAGKLIENFAKDYISIANELQTISQGWEQEKIYTQSQYPVTFAHILVHSPPPRV